MTVSIHWKILILGIPMCLSLRSHIESIALANKTRHLILLPFYHVLLFNYVYCDLVLLQLSLPNIDVELGYRLRFENIDLFLDQFNLLS